MNTMANLRDRFWENMPLKDMNEKEWEALCDGCGKCCLNKIEDADTGEVFLTRVACRLLDDKTCRCTQYNIRKKLVPECINLNADNIEKHAYWMPQTCAYRLLYTGESLPEWHPLLSGTNQTVHDANVSAQGITVSEVDVRDDEWEQLIIDEPGVEVAREGQD